MGSAAVANPEGPQIVAQDEHCVVGSLGNLHFSFSNGPVPDSMIDASERLYETLIERYPSGFARLSLVAGRRSIPDAARRERLQALSSRFAPHTFGLAMVMEGDGVWASAMRAVARRMLAASHRSCPFHLASSLPDAVRWLGNQSGDAADFDVSTATRRLITVRMGL